MKSTISAVSLFLFLNLSARAAEDTSNVQAQDNRHLGNNLIITSIQNPALAGLEYKHQAYFDYDQPWFDSFDDETRLNNYRTGYELVLKKINNKFRIGAGVYYSGEVLSHTLKRSIGLMNSLSIKFKNNSVLSIGVSFLAITLKKIDYMNLRFGNQFDGYGFNASIPSNDLRDVNSEHQIRYGPLSFGLWYLAENFFIGTSSVNLTVPKESYLEQYRTENGVRSPIVSYTNAGYHFDLKVNSSLLHPSNTQRKQFFTKISWSNWSGNGFTACNQD